MVRRFGLNQGYPATAPSARPCRILTVHGSEDHSLHLFPDGTGMLGRHPSVGGSMRVESLQDYATPFETVIARPPPDTWRPGLFGGADRRRPVWPPAWAAKQRADHQTTPSARETSFRNGGTLHKRRIGSAENRARHFRSCSCRRSSIDSKDSSSLPSSPIDGRTADEARRLREPHRRWLSRDGPLWVIPMGWSACCPASEERLPGCRAR